MKTKRRNVETRLWINKRKLKEIRQNQNRNHALFFTKLESYPHKIKKGKVFIIVPLQGVLMSLIFGYNHC